MKDRILIVDDDPVQRRILNAAVTRLGYEAVEAEGGDEALAALGGPDAEQIALVVLDLVMPDLDGMGVLAGMARAGIRKPVIVQTAHGGIDTVVSAMRAGASDFVVKPVSSERLDVSIRNALKLNTLEDEIGRLKRHGTARLTFADIVTRSPAMKRVIALGERAARSNIPIIIEGESGVGKELVARAIQGSSARSGKSFVPVNCGAIPENLVESTLFGHEKGAFTGATDKRTGKFLEAHGGTLFLDEVGELPGEAQVKLLRALQEGEIDPVGARKPVKVDFRLISATNRSMIDMVTEGRFREDLYYRLNVFPIYVPPLRDRREDVPLLARHFMTRFAAEEGKPVSAISREALDLLSVHDWPGNIRQLENAVFRAVVLADDDELGVEEFPQVRPGAPRSAPPRSRPVAVDMAVDMAADAAPEAVPATGVASQPIAEIDEFTYAPALVPETPDRLSMLSDDGEMRPMSEIEQEMIRFALDHYRGRMSEVARRLGIGRSTLYRKLRELGLDAAE
ncbi:MAG: sigma-54-dependent transcriptional regulator [Flavobacteriaceae bacterium]